LNVMSWRFEKAPDHRRRHLLASRTRQTVADFGERKVKLALMKAKQEIHSLSKDASVSHSREAPAKAVRSTTFAALIAEVPVWFR
jgi:hypothetical protein